MKSSHTLIVLIFSILACVNCQNFDVNALKARLSQFVNKDGVLDFEEQCRKNGANNIVSLEDEGTKLSTCITQYLLSSTRQEGITREIQESPRAKIELVCKYEPGSHKCMDQYADTVKSCMNETEKDIFNKGWKIVYNSLEYVCYRKGDRIARFIEDGGPQCIERRSTNLENCLMTVVNNLQVAANKTTGESYPTLTLVTAQECKSISALRTCVHDQLTQCSNNSPASIVDDFIQFLEEQLTCRNNASATTWNFVLLVLATLLSLFTS